MLQNCTKYSFSVLFVFLCTGFYSVAQNSSKTQQQFEKAFQFYNIQEYENAISEIHKLLKKSPDFVEATLLLADIYHDTRSTENEIKSLESALQYSQNPLIYYRLGKANYSGGNYEKALFNFEKYALSKGVSEVRKTEVQQLLKSCRFAIDAVKSPVDFNPERLSENINTVDDEYWPSISLDGSKLVFTRLLKPTAGLPQEDFFMAELDSAGWGKAVAIDEINTRENEGAQALSADGRLLFFTACNQPDGIGSCDIYYSVFKGNKWSTPKNAGNVLNSNSWDAQPTISSDNRFLYFSSNRAGGKGKKDIWRAELLEISGNGIIKWSTPENSGETVNSQGDEISPFIHPNNQDFYFASDCHAGMGGMDLFHAELQTDGTFSVPVNLGFPVNTFKDEQGFVISSDGSSGYFASARDQGFGLDIFTFLLPAELRPAPVSYIKVNVVDAETNQPIQAQIELIDLSDNNLKSRPENADDSGELMMCLPLQSNYAFNVSEPGYLFYSQSFQMADSNTILNPYYLEIKLNPVKPGAEMNLYNIYFETDSFRILPASEPELAKLTLFLENNSKIKIEIQGHTDNTGRPDRNLVLSELRAKSVAEYLIVKGIAKNRLQFKGLGESRPVTTNETVKGRMLNRRTTIKIDK